MLSWYTNKWGWDFTKGGGGEKIEVRSQKHNTVIEQQVSRDSIELPVATRF